MRLIIGAVYGWTSVLAFLSFVMAALSLAWGSDLTPRWMASAAALAGIAYLCTWGI